MKLIVLFLLTLTLVACGGGDDHEEPSTCTVQQCTDPK